MEGGMITIKIILGSTRPNRFGVQPANWLLQVAQNVEGATFEPVDLAELNLPFLDEPQVPAIGNYQQEHTKKWAKIVGPADGFVIVTPEYNHSYPASLKNAIDYLYAEWLHKPVAFVGYGSVAGGARAIEHLRGVVAYLDMFDISTHMLLPNYHSGLDEKGNFIFTEQHERAAKAMLERLVFWAERMKPGREELAGKQ